MKIHRQNDLRVCPECGGMVALASYDFGDIRFRAECTVCDMTGQWSDIEDKAVDSWNRGEGIYHFDEQPEDLVSMYREAGRL